HSRTRDRPRRNGKFTRAASRRNNRALSSTGPLVILSLKRKRRKRPMEQVSQAAVQNVAHAADPTVATRPYAAWTVQIARLVAVVAIEVALQQALGPLFLRRS